MRDGFRDDKVFYFLAIQKKMMGITKRIGICAGIKINEAPCGQVLNVDLRQTSAFPEGLISNISNVFPDCDFFEMAATTESF